MLRETKARTVLRALMVSRQHQKPLRRLYTMGVAIGIVFEHFALKAALKPRSTLGYPVLPRADDSNHA